MRQPAKKLRQRRKIKLTPGRPSILPNVRFSKFGGNL